MTLRLTALASKMAQMTAAANTTRMAVWRISATAVILPAAPMVGNLLAYPLVGEAVPQGIVLRLGVLAALMLPELVEGALDPVRRKPLRYAVTVVLKIGKSTPAGMRNRADRSRSARNR